ncbi:MAG: hypothetical protein QOF65_394 [Thermoleophilaceae bacterium]|jgi:hypothetical protein|nr:hypothetical protein [Thermoleophilaceae bacterium]MEA2435838.1 hypothetical protein [Thermoleophilaceae bacterium]
MTSPDEHPRRVPPNGNAWREAQREVGERNDLARKEGMAERASQERKDAARRRAREASGQIYR